MQPELREASRLDVPLEARRDRGGPERPAELIREEQGPPGS